MLTLAVDVVLELLLGVCGVLLLLLVCFLSTKTL